MTQTTRTRKCTRCQDATGTPTGMVLGGVCFLCGGAGSYTLAAKRSAAETAQLQARAAAVTIYCQAVATHPQRRIIRDGFAELEATEPERFTKMIGSINAGRIDAVLAALIAYATR